MFYYILFFCQSYLSLLYTFVHSPGIVCYCSSYIVYRVFNCENGVIVVVDCFSHCSGGLYNSGIFHVHMHCEKGSSEYIMVFEIGRLSWMFADVFAGFPSLLSFSFNNKLLNDQLSSRTRRVSEQFCLETVVFSPCIKLYD